ncbi:MAG: hypothetical protein HQK51_11770 [Oligoflexia bacterium]|nr:hypothetical protein [Oligoflexia bacterium]
MKTVLMFFFLATLPIIFFSCKQVDDAYNNGHEDGYNDGKTDYAAMVARAVKFGIYFEQYAPGYQMSFMKLANSDSKFAVYKDQTGMIRAIKYDDYNPNTSWWGNFFGKSNFLYGLTDNGNGTFSCNVGSCYEFMGINPKAEYISMVFEEVNPHQKDLEKAGALFEDMQIESGSEYLVQNYGLSEERAKEVAKLSYSWKKVSQKRSMTDKDAEIFSKKVLGVDVKFAEEAIKKSLFTADKSDYNNLIEKAAKINGVSPEHMNKIIDSILE